MKRVQAYADRLCECVWLPRITVNERGWRLCANESALETNIRGG